MGALLVFILLEPPAKAQLPASTPASTPENGGFRVSPDDISKRHSYPDLLKYPKLSDDPEPAEAESIPAPLVAPDEEPPPVPSAAPTPNRTLTTASTPDHGTLNSGPFPAGISNIGNSFPQFMSQNLALSDAPQVVGLRGGVGRIRVGPFHIGLGVAGSTAYNSNVFGSSSNPQGDIISTFAPEIYIQAGTRGTFELFYRPSYERYLKYTNENTVNESLSARLRYPFTRLSLEADLSYIRQSGLFAQSNGISQQALYAFRLVGNYKISTKTQASARLETFYQAGDSSTQQIEHDLTLEVENTPTPKLRFAGGLKVGYVTAQEQVQTFAQPYLRASFHPDSHWSFSAQLGVEVREFSEEVNPQHQLISPVANITLSYSPYESSSFDLSFYQVVFNDSFQSTIVNTQTGVRAALYFKLFNHVRIHGYVDAFHTSQSTPDGEDAGAFDFISASLTATYVFHDGVELHFFNNAQQRFTSSIGDGYFGNVSGMSISLNF